MMCRLLLFDMDVDWLIVGPNVYVVPMIVIFVSLSRINYSILFNMARVVN
jgi:hypothetical protein